MKWQCRQARRRIERFVAAGRSIDVAEGHLARCACCRAHLAEMTAVHESLGLLRTDIAAPEVDSRVWQEIDRRIAASSPSRARAWAFAPAALAVSYLIVTIVATHLPGTQSAPQPGEPGIKTTSAARSPIEYAENASGPVTAEAVRLPIPTHLKSPTIVRHGSERRNRLRIARHTKPRTSPAVEVAAHETSPSAKTPAHLVWARWGSWYEQNGDYERASAAYAEAQSATGVATPTVYSYEAGRAAECAGDLTTAVEYYSKMLSRPAGQNDKPKAEKGA